MRYFSAHQVVLVRHRGDLTLVFECQPLCEVACIGHDAKLRIIYYDLVILQDKVMSLAFLIKQEERLERLVR